MRFIVFALASLLLAPSALAEPAPTEPGKGWRGSQKALIERLRKRDYKGVAKAAELIVKQNAKDYEAQYLLGRAMFHLKKDRAAVRHLSKAIELKPDYPNPYFFRAMTLAYSKKSKEAAKDFEKAAELAPKEAIYWVELARNYARMGNAPAAASGMEKAIGINPKRPQGWYLLGNYRMRAGDPINARAAWEKAVELKPHHLQAHLSLGQYHQTAGHPQKAAVHYAAILEKKPHDSSVLEKMIQVHNQQGLYAEAERFRARYVSRLRGFQEMDPGYVPGRPRKVEVHQFCIDQFRPAKDDVFTYEIQNKTRTDPVYIFRLIRNGSVTGAITLEAHADKKGAFSLVFRKPNTRGVATGHPARLGGLGAKAPPPPPPPQPGKTLATYDQKPTYAEAKRDVTAALIKGL